MFRLLKLHKAKLFLLVFSILAFAVLLFPFGDLSDLVTTKVAELTGNQVYLQFDQMNLSAIPVGIELSEVLVETSMISGLKAQNIVFTPNISSLIFQKPAGTVTATGLLGGDVKVSISPGKKTEKEVQLQQLELQVERISLAKVQSMAGLTIPLKGNINLEASAQLDLTLTVQPDIEMTLTIDQFELPPASINTALGPITLPDLKLSSIELVGRLSNGRFDIQKGTLGKAGDELTGILKGSLGLTLVNNGGMIAPQFSEYDLVVDLSIKKSLEDRATLFLALLQPYKSPSSDGGQYKFKVAGQNFFAPPSLTAP